MTIAMVREDDFLAPGWDESLSWHEGAFIAEWFMVENFVGSLDRKDGQDR